MKTNFQNFSNSFGILLCAGNFYKWHLPPIAHSTQVVFSVGGLGGADPIGKSFRFVRACVRAINGGVWSRWIHCSLLSPRRLLLSIVLAASRGAPGASWRRPGASWGRLGGQHGSNLAPKTEPESIKNRMKKRSKF